MRVLTKGGSVSGIQHDEAEWNELANIKDYDIVILNLQTIHEKAGELATPDSSIPQSIEFPSTEDIIKHLSANNSLYIFLPETRKINLLRVEDQETSEEEVDLLSWLPFKIFTSEEPGKSVDSNSVHNRWQWYFNSDFDWPMYLSSVSLREEALPIQYLLDIVHQQTIAQTTFEEDIASEISIVVGVDLAAELGNGDLERTYPGSIHLLPLQPEYSFSEAAAGILSQLHMFSVEPKSVPDWVEEKILPRQQEILQKSQALKDEFERLDRFKKLLYVDGQELEEVVLRAFDELGIETLPERSGKRDGAVLLDEKVFILEAHGTQNAVGVKKVDQLNRWVRNAQEEFSDRDVEGLLVANAYRRQNPKNRGQAIVGDPKDDLEDYGFKLLNSTQLYEFLQESQQGEFSKRDMAEALRKADPFVTRL